ncbi:TrfB-related DNA-binding protein, partial [Klebsiella pneumoniae]|nr:TrfB-related DNA-binding protein [Klebsiella pneumoniae]
MAQKNRISETEWKQLLPQMASFAHITTDIGYSVLVKGEKSSDVATRVGRSKQNISSTVKRIWDLYQNTTLKAENGEPLKLVQVWIPASRHCCKVSDEAAFCLIQRPYISKTLLTRRISPRG